VATIWSAIRVRHPTFCAAVAADARITARYRGERDEFRSPLDAACQAIRLAWVSDAFLAQVLHRAKARGQVLLVARALRPRRRGKSEQRRITG